MSHELRTPLNAIGGYAELLEMGVRGPVTADQLTDLARIKRAQRHLLGLINDVLNYAKLESGRVEFVLGSVDVRDVIADVTPLVAPQLAAKGLVLDVRLPDGPCEVWTDRDKLGQVLINLLSNATKFTAPRDDALAGRVTIDLATRRGAGTDLVFLRVADTGLGIPRNKQAAVFEPFVQLQSGYARATEGTGLGLAISRDLARGMGGDLRVRSVEGWGSTFTIVLRRVAAADGTRVDRRTSTERPVDEERRSGHRRRHDDALT
jgi:signal transduction histidine kinase